MVHLTIIFLTKLTIKRLIITCNEKLNPKIEHIGSTSVPNLSAKPIIDIQVGIENSYDLDKTIEPMINNHYIYYELYEFVILLCMHITQILQ